MRLCTHDTNWRCIALFLLPLILVGCGTVSKAPPPAESAPAGQASVPKSSSRNIPALPPAGSGRGGYYLDDGPGDNIPEGLLDMPDPEPQVEPYSKRGNSPYVVFGKRYVPFTDDRPFKQRGIGSWYGKKFHGQKTSSGELYDMYKMTAAHPTLPIPSYVRVTNVANGKQVIVRVNDRGPFHSGRIIDLSFTAALKLGYLGKGSGELEVERLLPDEIERMARARREQQAAETAVASAPAPVAPAAAAATPVAVVDTRQPDVKPAIVAAGADAPPQAASGFYVQFGAYSQASNAEAMRARLMQNWASNLPPIEVAEYGLFYRLYSGPYATRAEAAMAALQLQNAGSAKPMIVQR